MSDIFIKTGSGGSTGWRKMSNLFVKTSSGGLTGWRAATKIFLKAASGWLSVWPFSGVFATRTAWVGADSTTAYADRLTSSSVIRIGSNYYGNNAQWDANGWTISSYSYAWRYYDSNSNPSLLGTLDSGTGSGWTAGGTGQDLLPTTIWTSTNSANTDRKYLAFEVTANASNSSYNGFSRTPYFYIIRRPPLVTNATLSTNSPQVGTAVTYTASWDTSEARKEESNRTTIQWYRNTTSSTTGGTLISGATTSSYTPVSGDAGSYLYVVETRYNSGTDYDFGSTGSEARVATTNPVSSAPTGSGFAASDITAFPSPAPSNVSVSGSTSNNATISWTNPTSDLTSISVAYSGAGTTGSPFTDTASPFETSISRAYTSSANISVTVTATNNNKRARISWSQSNAASYTIVYTISGIGQITDNINNSSSNPVYDITVGSTSRTVTLNSITLYASANQQGASITYTPASVSVTPADKSSIGTGNGNVTYTPPQYTVTWNATANGGTGGGTTTQNAGVAHTAPSASRNSFTVTFSSLNATSGSPTVSSVTGLSPFVRWADSQGTSTGTGDFLYSASAGGSFTPPSSITMYARWNQTTSSAVTLSGQGTLSRTGFTFGGWNIGGTTYAAGASYTPSANVTADPVWISNNVAPSNGSVTIALSSGTAGRVGATYAVTSATASGTPTPTVSAYQWQYYNSQFDIWVSITNATSSSYTISFGNSTYSDIGRTLRCLVTFSNGVTPNLNTGSNSINIANPTITSITSTYSTTSPFVVYRVFGYNMQAITTKAIINGTQQSGNTVSGSTNNNATTGITRNIINGGSGSTYACIVRPEALSGGGGALGTTVTTNTLTNNLTNRNNSPVTNTFTAGGSV